MLFEKTGSLGLNIDSQANLFSKGVAIGEKSNTVVGCIFSETKKTLTCIKAKDRELNYRSIFVKGHAFFQKKEMRCYFPSGKFTELLSLFFTLKIHLDKLIISVIESLFSDSLCSVSTLH